MRRFPRKCILLAAALLSVAGVARAGFEGTELPFVAGTGGRASGMGLAATTLFGPPSAQYFNPALVAHAERQQFEFYRTTLFDSDSQFHSASYAYPTLDWGTVGVTVLRLDVGSIEERDEMNNLLSTDLKNSMTRMLIGYGMQVHPRLAAGANFKIDRQAFGDVNDTGIGADVGVVFNHEMDGPRWLGQLRAALAVENVVEPTMKLDQDDVADPMRLSVGVSADVHYRQFATTTAIDVISPRESPARVCFGQEVKYADYFAFRFGIDGSTPTLGFGGSYRDLSLDYAYRSADLGSNHRVALGVAFGASRQTRMRERQVRLDAELERRVRTTVNDMERRQMGTLTRRADALFDAGEYADAHGQYEMLLLWDPGNTHAAERTQLCSLNARLRTAERLMEDGNYLDALQPLKQAQLASPGDERVEALIAECQNRVDEAADQTQMVERLLTTSIDLYAHGEYADARTGFEEVLRLDPENRIGREYYDKSLESLRADLGKHRRRARSLEERGDLAGAVHELRAALAHEFETDQLKKDLARLEAKLAAAKEEAAAEQPEPARVSPRVDTAELDRRFEAGVTLLESGRFGESARELMRVWAASPTHRNVAKPLTRAYLFMGMEMYSQGDYADAITVWEKILTIDPTNVKARRYLKKSREEAARLGRGD